eukprot:6188333-Pleurochrysis_carterae.AAC.2
MDRRGAVLGSGSRDPSTIDVCTLTLKMCCSGYDHEHRSGAILAQHFIRTPLGWSSSVLLIVLCFYRRVWTHRVTTAWTMGTELACTIAELSHANTEHEPRAVAKWQCDGVKTKIEHYKKRKNSDSQTYSIWKAHSDEIALA